MTVLFYDDDIVVFGTDESDFQNNLYIYIKYSDLWYLTINFDKSNIILSLVVDKTNVSIII